MKSIKNRGILLFGFFLLIFFVVLTSLIGVLSLNKTNKLFEYTYSDIFAEVLETEQSYSNLIAIHRAMKDVALSKNATQFQAALNDVYKYDSQINENFKALNIIDANNGFLIEVIKAYKDWEPIRAKTLEFTKNGQYELAAENTRTLGAAQVNLINEKMQLLIGYEKKQVQASYEESETILKNSLSILLWLTFCSLVLIILTSIFISRKLLSYENELQNEKEQQRITFESIGDGIITTDTSRNVLRLNKVAEEMTGWTSEEAMGKPFLEVFDIINSSTGEKGKDPVDEVLLSDQICELANHTVLISKEGTKRHIADSAAPIKDQNGDTTGVVMVFRDVTEKIKFQEQLQISEEHYRMLFNSMMNGYALHEMIFDENGIPCDYRFVDINPAFEEMTGMKKPDCIGNTIKSLMPEIEDYWISTYGNVAITGEPIKYENFSEGIGKYFEIYAFRPIENHFAVLVADTTERKKLEDLVHVEKEQLRITFESIGDGIITTDTSRNVLRLNKVAEEMTGWTSEEAMGKPFLEVFDIINSSTGEKGKDPVDEVLLSDQICELANHTVLISKDGTKRHIADSAAPIKDRNGDTTGVVMVFRDVTEKKMAQNALEESETLLLESQKVAHVGSYMNDVINGTWTSSAELERIFGVDKEYPHTLEGWVNIVHPDWREKLSKYASEVYSEQTFFDMEYKIIRINDGVERWVHGLGKLYFDENGNTIKMIGTIQDVTERKLKDEEILYRSSHDILTGLYNRRKFEDVLSFAEESGETPVSILVGDVNSLKLINDAYGHAAGDIILKKIAEIIKEVCGDNAYCTRRGGDEYAIILPKTTYEEACAIVMKIKKRCMEESKDELVLTITFGVGTKAEKEQSLEKIQHLAEERMYTAKLLEGKNIRSTIVENLRMVLEEKTGETRNHCTRMSEMSQIIGEQMGFQAFEISNLKLLSLLHDIGKTGIPESILLKPGKLDEDEFSIIQKHCEIGYRIANTMPELVPIAEGILCHHERWDGNGYPQGLLGDKIPILSRIVQVLDAYDAMINDRPYRKAISKEEAIEEIKRCSGTQFDTEVVNVFLNNCIM